MYVYTTVYAHALKVTWRVCPWSPVFYMQWIHNSTWFKFFEDGLILLKLPIILVYATNFKTGFSGRHVGDGKVSPVGPKIRISVKN